MSRAGLVVAVALLAAALLFPALVALPYPRDVLIRVFLFATLAQAWNILAGYCGQISLGHAIFFATGALPSGMFVAKELGSPVDRHGGRCAHRRRAVHGDRRARFGLGHYLRSPLRRGRDRPHPRRQLWRSSAPRAGSTSRSAARQPRHSSSIRTRRSTTTIVLGLLVVGLVTTRLIERSRLGYYFRAVARSRTPPPCLGVPSPAPIAWPSRSSAARPRLRHVLRPVRPFIDPESVFPLSLSILSA